LPWNLPALIAKAIEIKHLQDFASIPKQHLFSFERILKQLLNPSDKVESTWLNQIGLLVVAVVNMAQRNDYTFLHLCAQKNNQQAAIFQQKVYLGYMPLYSATRQSCIAVAELFIDEGAEIDALDDYGNTPLHKATYENDLSTVKLLIQKNARVDIKNIFNRTPLDKAKDSRSFPEIMCLLAEHYTSPILRKN
jgi:ankyrin repeat protein